MATRRQGSRELLRQPPPCDDFDCGVAPPAVLGGVVPPHPGPWPIPPQSRGPAPVTFLQAGVSCPPISRRWTASNMWLVVRPGLPLPPAALAPAAAAVGVAGRRPGGRRLDPPADRRAAEEPHEVLVGQRWPILAIHYLEEAPTIQGHSGMEGTALGTIIEQALEPSCRYGGAGVPKELLQVVPPYEPVLRAPRQGLHNLGRELLPRRSLYRSWRGVRRPGRRYQLP